MDKQLLKQIIERYETSTFTINRIMSAWMRERMPDNLTTEQLAVMRFISGRGTCTSSELADVFLVGKSSITAIIKRLAEKGLIQRLTDDKDRRYTFLSLTAEGKQVVEEMNGKVEDMLTKFINHFDDQEAISLIETLEKMANILIQAEGGRVKV